MPPDTGLFGLPKPTEEERRAALAEKGPSWRSWFLTSFAMVYLGLALLILDVIALASYAEAGLNLGGLVPLALGLLYLEYLLYQYLWYRPALGGSRSVARAEGSRREALGWRYWLHPFEVGRWTHHFPEGRRGAPPEGPSGPTPEEFL